MAKQKTLFNDMVNSVLTVDPVFFCQNYLTLDGQKFTLSGNGYKPFADIYRYIGIKALEPNAKPLILVKGRQVGGTTMAAALELFFMASGLFGTNNRYPMRVLHCFPLLDLGYKYTKTKLNLMIKTARSIDELRKGKKQSFIESKIDRSASSNDSLQFKQFQDGNHLFIESTGITGDRIRSLTGDCMFFDECFPYHQNIETEDGRMKIGKMYKYWTKNKSLPLVKTFNEYNENFEYKQITNVWKRGKRPLIQITGGRRKIKCTDNHKFLTYYGWKQASDLNVGDLIKASLPMDHYIRAINEDQLQIVLGSFLGDGHLDRSNISRYRLRVIHGIKQEDYCKWKANMFNSPLTYIEKNGYGHKPAVSFSTRLFGMPSSFPKIKNTCPQWVLDKLDARGLAIWFMDDGSVSSGINACISTCSFDEESQKRIVEKLQSMGIDCNYKYYKHRDSGYFSIYLNKKGYVKLCEIISPYIHKNLLYKLRFSINDSCSYNWNNNYKQYGFIVVDKIIHLSTKEYVYDIEVEDNHNFIASSRSENKHLGGFIAHNCQDISGTALTNSLKILNQAKYGSPGDGVQVYFGTPKQKGSEFHNIWRNSSQQYYHLGCGKCQEYFPLYTPDSNDWEDIWIEDDLPPDHKSHGFVVQCIYCGTQQDKREAAERGKWLSSNKDEDPKYIGYHLNQLYMPHFTRSKIIAEKPENHPINTERSFANEVMGEFFTGDGSLITREELQQLCGDMKRGFRKGIDFSEDKRVYMGIDWGQMIDTEQVAGGTKQQGQSYTAVVVMSLEGPELLSLEYCHLLKSNDMDYKKAVIEQIKRTYSCTLISADIGYGQAICEALDRDYGDQFFATRAHGAIKNHAKYMNDVFPKEVRFERNYFIELFFSWLKKGKIRLPYKMYEQIGMFITQVCDGFNIKPSLDRSGVAKINYVKSSVPNDYAMAAINCFIAYMFDVTNGFSSTLHPDRMDKGTTRQKQIMAVLGHVPSMNPLKRFK
jgi:hypothetical protein